MSYAIQMTEKAKNDLNDIFSYIAFQIPQLNSLQNAEQQILRLEKGIYSLDELPSRFPLYAEEPWHSMGMRVMPIDNYIVFYRIEKEAVYIYRILYKRRNVMNNF